jgi:hypothetical protein
MHTDNRAAIYAVTPIEQTTFTRGTLLSTGFRKTPSRVAMRIVPDALSNVK